MADQLLQGMDLTYIRTEVRKALPDKVSIQRRTWTGDGQGGFAEGWSNVYQDIAARFTSTGGSESVAENRREAQMDFTLTLGYDQSIEATDRVVHTSGTYEVQTVDTGKSWATSKRCQVRLL